MNSPDDTWVDEFGVLWAWDPSAENGEGRYVPTRKASPAASYPAGTVGQ